MNSIVIRRGRSKYEWRLLCKSVAAVSIFSKQDLAMSSRILRSAKKDLSQILPLRNKAVQEIQITIKLLEFTIPKVTVLSLSIFTDHGRDI